MSSPARATVAVTKAMRIHGPGGPEVMCWEDVAVGAPGPGQVRLRQHAIGLNFVDVYHRTGLYKLPLPAVLGVEGAGVVEALGPGVTALQIGDRVAYERPPGAYAEMRLAPADRMVRLPDAISFEQAAGLLLKGLTVQMLVRRVYRVRAGETVLLHAAAGGVGLLACQWLRSLGVTVIGTVGTQAKAELARANGCTHVLVLGEDDIPARVRQLTDGAGVPVVYDSIGRDTFALSLQCLRPMGMMVSVGTGRAVCAVAAGGTWLPVPHAPVLERLRDARRRLAGHGRRTVRAGAGRAAQCRHPATLPAARRRPGTPRPGGPPHHGCQRAVALIGADSLLEPADPTG